MLLTDFVLLYVSTFGTNPWNDLFLSLFLNNILSVRYSAGQLCSDAWFEVSLPVNSEELH